MRKKTVLALLLISILLSIFFSNIVKADQDKVITVWGSEITRENEVMREIAQEFKNETGIRVLVIDRRSLFDAPRDLINNAQTKEKPDIVMIQHADIGDLAVNGFLLELDFAEELKSAFHESAFTSFEVKDKQYGIGYSVETYGLVYNRDVISSEQITNLTWDEFFDYTVNFGTVIHNGKPMKAFILNPKNMYFMYPIIKNYGGYYYGIDDNGNYNPFDVGLNNEGSKIYVEKIKSLMKHGLVINSRNGTDNDVSAAFANQEAAVIINGFWQNSFYKQKGVNFGFAPLPMNNDKTVSSPYATVNGFVINAHSDYPDEAKAFLEFMCKDEYQQMLIEAGNNYDKKVGSRFPVNLSVRESAYIKSEEMYEVMAGICENIEPVPNIPEGDIWYNYTDKAYQSIFYGDINGNPVNSDDMLDELSTAILNDVKKMNVKIEKVDIPFLGYFFIGCFIAVCLAILIITFVRRRRKFSISANRIMLKATFISYLVLLPVLVLIGIFYLFPIVHNIYLSMTDYSSLNLVDYVFIGGYNYKTIFIEGLSGFASMFAWTVIFASSVMVITFLTGTMLATLLEKRKAKVAKIYKMIFILPWVIPSVIMLLTWQGILATDGGALNNLLNMLGFGKVMWLDNPYLARLCTIFVVSWMGTPYYMFLALGFLKSIPKDYYEAAMIEGAGKIKVFFAITVPIIFRALLPTLIMGFIMQFNNFGVYLLTSGGPFGSTLGAPGATDLLITYVYNLAYNTKNYGLAAAYSVIIFLFVAAFSLITMKIGNSRFNEGK
ncbi:MAG TPA: extracellular solute-binding protein [Clostridia bacterium]|nr:extracellular solute-binding protein [Clostridia bacterium]